MGRLQPAPGVHSSSAVAVLAPIITAVDPGSRWISQTSLPGGRLVIDHEVNSGADGVVVRKTYTAEGPMALAFRWFFAKDIRAQMPGSFAALEAEIIRRRAARS